MTRNWHLHLSPTNCRFESRLFKETESVASMFPAVERIVIVGRWENGLAVEEMLDAKRTIVRLKLLTTKLPRAIRPPGLVFAEWLLRIVVTYLLRVPRVVSSHSVFLLPMAVCFKLVGAQVVYDAHELETERNGLHGARKLAAKLIEASLIRFADSVIVVGNAIADWYADRYRMRRPGVVLNCPRFKPLVQPKSFHEIFQLRESQRVFLYQGGLFPGRGIELLMDAFMQSKRSDVCLVIMGYGALETSVVAATKRSHRVRFQPAVPPSEVLSYTAGANFGISNLVFPDSCLSYYYSSPNKLFEYLMAGLPVVVSDAPEMKAVVAAYNVGCLVKSPTVESVWTAIDGIMRMDYRDLRQRVNEVRSHFSWEQQEAILRSEYNRILGLTPEASSDFRRTS